MFVSQCKLLITLTLFQGHGVRVAFTIYILILFTLAGLSAIPSFAHFICTPAAERVVRADF